MGAPKWPAKVKKTVLDGYEEHGPAEMSRQTGVPVVTCRRWAREKGITNAAITKNPEWAAAQESRKLALADRLHAEAEQLLDELHTPVRVKKVVTVNDGGGESHWEVAEMHLDEPTPADKTKLMTAVAIAIDKMQLLTGDATSRNEETHTWTEAEARARLGDDVVDMAKERAVRRAA